MLKKHIEKIVTDKFDIPLDGILDVPNAQLIGNKQLYIDGCTGIKKYEENEIIISTKSYSLRVTGKELSMLTFSQGRVCIRGIIEQYNVTEVM